MSATTTPAPASGARSLDHGTVKGDEISCPFHDWRWGGDGKCKAIPYAWRIPLRARTQKYETAERNGLLMIWHDPEGSAADVEILPPALEGISDPDIYTDWTWHQLGVPTAHCREIVDNVVDMAHFFYIHFAFPTNFRNVFEGHTYNGLAKPPEAVGAESPTNLKPGAHGAPDDVDLESPGDSESTPSPHTWDCLGHEKSTQS